MTQLSGGASGEVPPGSRGQVYRVEWVPGTDHLLGLCFCGAQHLEVDPIALWEWLHAHPHGHEPLLAEPFPTQLSEVPV
jgi:hypothetical protein